MQFLVSIGPWQPAARSVAAVTRVWALPVAAGAAAVLLASRCMARVQDERLLQLWDDWPAWSATLLLILQPLHQLVSGAGLLDHMRVHAKPANIACLLLLPCR